MTATPMPPTLTAPTGPYKTPRQQTATVWCGVWSALTVIAAIINFAVFGDMLASVDVSVYSGSISEDFNEGAGLTVALMTVFWQLPFIGLFSILSRPNG